MGRNSHFLNYSMIIALLLQNYDPNADNLH
jgi:hypothetical protein